jgi:hypothetical protein
MSRAGLLLRSAVPDVARLKPSISAYGILPFLPTGAGGTPSFVTLSPADHTVLSHAAAASRPRARASTPERGSNWENARPLRGAPEIRSAYVVGTLP